MLKVFAPIYYLGATVLAAVLVFSALAEADLRAELTEFETASEKTDTLFKDWAERLSLGLYQGATEKATIMGAIEAQIAAHARRARFSALTLGVLSAAFLIGLAGSRIAERPPRSVIRHLAGVSAILLVVGLSAPLLTVSAHKDIALLGRVVLQYDTKGILSTIVKLVSTGNNLLAAMLILFSLLLPIAKVVMTLLALVNNPRLHRFASNAVHAIGRWSMTDVFVVAILLAFLAANSDQLTDASTGYGLFFFAAYGLLSLTAGHLLLKHREELAAGSRVPALPPAPRVPRLE